MFVVSEHITMKFDTGVDHQGVNSNSKKDLHKINDAIDNDVIILRPLLFVQKYMKQKT